MTEPQTLREHETRILLLVIDDAIADTVATFAAPPNPSALALEAALRDIREVLVAQYGDPDAADL